MKLHLFALAGSALLLSMAFGCDAKDQAASATASNPPSASADATPASSTAQAAKSEATPAAATPAEAPTATPSDPPTKPTKADLPKFKSSGLNKPPAEGEPVAVVSTNLGDIVLKFFPDKAPMHVANFIKLANAKFYDGTKFHRVIPGFMIQGGDPNTKPGGDKNGPPGTGGPGYSIDAEFNDIHHVKGILSMARSQDQNSAGSQFFIVVGDAGFLDNQYTAFGQVVKGQDVADKIVALPTGESQQDMPNAANEAIVKSIRIVKWPVK